MGWRHAELPIEQLRAVVVATDGSGPWGDDFVFLLHGAEDNPVGLFPLEANGRAEFVEWLSLLPGHSDEELRKASGSTRLARFKVTRVQTLSDFMSASHPLRTLACRETLR